MSASDRRARGVLRRRLVKSTYEVYIGKESNRLEEVEAGLVHDLVEALAEYPDPKRGTWNQLVVPILRDIPASWLQERTGLSRRSVQRLRNRHSRPRREHEASLTAVAVEFARWRLEQSEQRMPREDLSCLQAYRSNWQRRRSAKDGAP